MKNSKYSISFVYIEYINHTVYLVYEKNNISDSSVCLWYIYSIKT